MLALFQRFCEPATWSWGTSKVADATEQRDFFISFNGADLEYAKAIDAALRAEGFTTYFHPNDLDYGGNIPLWMDKALMNARQMLALYSPAYIADEAVYSEAERYARFWQDTRGSKFKLVPVELKQTVITPMMSVYKRLDVKGKTPDQAGATVVEALKKPDEIKQRQALDNPEPMPAVFNVLYGRNPNFSGRFEAMESLQKTLREGNAAITALAGMGGVGKTTLAAEYCHRFGARYGGVWWIRAEQESVMLSDLAALGARVGCTTSGNIEIDARTALEYLVSQPKPWLIVYDNAPNPDAVTKWRPGGAVRCLITSRYSGFDGIAKVTPLGEWSDDVAADYLIARTGRDDKPGALRLAHALGGLPLAAEQAAVFLRGRKGISFDNYATDIAELIKRPRPKGATGDYPDTVYAAFVKSLETLGTIEGGETALDILRLCAFLSPDGVDLGLLMADKNGAVLPAPFAKAMTNSTAREDSLAALVSQSLLRQEDGPFGAVLIFHRLLLEVVRDWMGADARALWGSAAVQLVSRLFPWVEVNTWQLCARLMPHVATLDALAPTGGKDGKALDRLLNQGCVYLHDRGDRVGALLLAEKSVALKRTTRADEPLQLATSLDNLGGRLSDLGRLDEAERFLLEALAIEKPLLEPTDPSLAITLSNLGEVYWRRKQFEKVEPILIDVMKIMSAAHGASSADFGTSLSNLAALYSVWSDEPGQKIKLKTAADYATKALTITRGAIGLRNPSTSARHSGLAIIRAKQNNFLAAASEMETALAIMFSLDLVKHPHTQQRYLELSVIWRRTGETDKAARLELSDISDLLPIIGQIESEHRAWVAEDPANRHFGPPSPFKF